jgi:hypothetical protein
MRDIKEQLDSYQDHLDSLYPAVTLDGLSDIGVTDGVASSKALIPRNIVVFGVAFVSVLLLGIVAYVVGGFTATEADVDTPISRATATTADVVVVTESPTTAPLAAELEPSTTTTRSQLVPPTAFVPPEIYPPDGLNLTVVGVSHDGSLDVWQEPETLPIIMELGPLDTVQSAGEGFELADSTWWKIDADGTIGWVDASYLASWASPRLDLTASVVDEHGNLPTARTMEELGRLVAETLTSEGYVSRIAMVEAPTVGNPQLATFDVVASDPLGLTVAMRGFTGQTGWRLRVAGALDAYGFILENVEGRPFQHACACWLG